MGRCAGRPRDGTPHPPTTAPVGHSRLAFPDQVPQFSGGMKFILSTHNITLTQAIEDHILTRIDKLEHLYQRALEARVIVEHDHTRGPEKAFKCSIRLAVRGNDLYAEDVEGDLYAAIDLVAKKVETQIRKKRSKVKARKHTEAATIKLRRQDNGE